MFCIFLCIVLIILGCFYQHFVTIVINKLAKRVDQLTSTKVFKYLGTTFILTLTYQ